MTLTAAPTSLQYSLVRDQRHTSATSYLRAGGRRETLRQQLGHQSTRTIDVYEHMDETDVRADVALLEAHRG